MSFNKSICIVFLITACAHCTNESNVAKIFIDFFSINLVNAKNLSSPIDINHQIKQLNQIYDAHSQRLIQLQQQFSDSQQDIDILRGYIQDMQHRLSEIMHNQEEIHQCLQNLTNQNSKNNTKVPSCYTNKSINKTSVNTDLETYINDNIERKNINNADIDYKLAVKLVLEKKQYNQAIEEFKKFIINHPKSDYQPNAHYWLGQLYYNQGNKKDAAYHFAWVAKNYPKSTKAPDALLKIGIIMQETNQKDKSKVIYRQIGKLYPNSEAAKQAQKRLSCL